MTYTSPRTPGYDNVHLTNVQSVPTTFNKSQHIRSDKIVRNNRSSKRKLKIVPNASFLSTKNLKPLIGRVPMYVLFYRGRARQSQKQNNEPYGCTATSVFSGLRFDESRHRDARRLYKGTSWRGANATRRRRPVRRPREIHPRPVSADYFPRASEMKQRGCATAKIYRLHLYRAIAAVGERSMSSCSLNA